MWVSGRNGQTALGLQLRRLEKARRVEWSLWVFVLQGPAAVKPGDRHQETLGRGETGTTGSWRQKILGARTGRTFCHVCEAERESSSVTGGNTCHGHNPAMALGHRLARAESSMMISTRRFFCRPSAVLLSATGVVSPRP